MNIETISNVAKYPTPKTSRNFNNLYAMPTLESRAASAIMRAMRARRPAVLRSRHLLPLRLGL